MPKNLILWLEDRPKTCDKFRKYCERYGFEVTIVATDHQFHGFLKQNLDDICLIIVDLMVYGISNLINIGVKNSDTSAGYNAGWVIIERLLQPGKQGPYSHIPVAILSTRTATEKDEERLARLRTSNGEIPYFEKHGITPDGQSCGNKFNEYLAQVKRSCQ